MQTRISVGFGTMLVVLVSVATTDWVLITGIEHHVREFRTAIAERAAGREMELQVAYARIRVNQWLRSMNPTYAVQAHTLLTQLVHMAGLVETIARQGHGPDYTPALLQKVTAFTASLTVIEGLYADESRLHDEVMIAAGARIRTDVAQARAGASARANRPAVALLADALEAFAEAETSAVRFRASAKGEDALRVAEAMARVHANIQRALAATKDAPIADALTRAGAAAQLWNQAFGHATTIGQTRAARVISWTHDEGEPMGRLAHAVEKAGETRATAVEAAQFSAIARGRSILGAITAIGLLFGAGFSWLLARSIITPLARITLALRSLASGNRTEEIPETDRTDEIGEMARCATLFKDNAIAMEAMAVQQKALEAQRTSADVARQHAEAELAAAHERQQAERALNIQNVRFGAALSNMSQALCMFDREGGLIVANGRVAEMFNIDPAGICPGETMEDLLSAQISVANLQPPDVVTLCDAIRDLQAAGEPGAADCALLDERTLLVNFGPMDGDGWLVTLEDISQRRQAEARIAHMAHHDALTGLPNRLLFHDRLAAAVARSVTGERSAVLYLDLDHFKGINDTLGHPVGDSLLREATARLRQNVRKTDTVARLGGDEFAVVQCRTNQPEDAIALAERLIEVMGQPFEFDGHQMTIGTSIGIAVMPEDGESPDQLLSNADMALYCAKADGRGRYRFFQPAMSAIVQGRRTLETDLRRALVKGEFELYYQPLMDVRTRSVNGFEALLRWNHPERGVVSPAEFVPLAEEIGLIMPIGKWVLHQACTEATTWPAPLKVAVNVSVVQFSGNTLIEDVADALQISGLHPSRLELEITETIMVEDPDRVLAILHQLRDLGVSIAMDDFGTGYSSLSYLRQFPFSKVKIDRSFIDGLGKGGDCDTIVSAMTDLCKSLGMTTLAEGVETEEQLQRLRLGNCIEAQGYLFSPPRPAAEIAALCRTLGQRRVA